MRKDDIHEALTLGNHVAAARRILQGTDAFAAFYRQDYQRGKLKLVLSEQAPECEALEREFGIPPQLLSSEPQVYALSKAAETGCVRLFAMGSVSPCQDADFVRSCSDGIASSWQFLRDLRPDGHNQQPPPTRFSLRCLANPERNVSDATGTSAGLAAALAAVCEDPRFRSRLKRSVAATGEVDSKGCVRRVDDLVVKLEALRREAPHVEMVCIPRKNNEPIPSALVRDLDVFRVDTVRDAITQIWPALAQPPKIDRTTISCDTTAERSFFTKITYEEDLPLHVLENRIVGWDSVDDAESLVYWSKLGLDGPSDRFAVATRDLVPLSDTRPGIRAPLVYRLDLNHLQGSIFFESGSVGGRLDAVDLLLLRNSGTIRAAFGYWFVGNPCCFGDYLAWLSQRAHRQLLMKQRRIEEPLCLDGVHAELVRALSDGSAPDRDRMRTQHQQRRPLVCQLLLTPASHKWPPRDFSTAYAHAATRSPLGAAAPRDSFASWEPPGVRTRYGVSVDTLTAWAHGSLPFNRNSKWKVLGTALYAQWMIARQLARTCKDAAELQTKADAIARCHEEPLRQGFFERCVNFYRERWL